MKTNTRQRHQRRIMITREAARLMYEEGVKQYMDAKHIAARRIFGYSGAKRLRFRPHDLPSNGEIREALLELAHLHEGHLHQQRLFAMRITALQCMDNLLPFRPKLIGSVSTGHVRRGSDIDLHVFTDLEEHVELHLHSLGWTYELDRVTIRKHGQFQTFTHAHILDFPFPIELSIYPPEELRKISRSSTDGKPIVRLSPKHLTLLLQEQHPHDFQTWQTTQTIPHLDTFLNEHETLSLADIEALDDEFDDDPL